jgi:hypothetical protein
MSRTLLACGFLLGAAVGGAEPTAKKPLPLLLHPAAPPARALQYPLLPELRDKRPGNAAEYYRKAYQLFRENLEREYYETTDPWLEMPLKDLPRAEVAKFLEPHAAAFRALEAAARCESCDWEVTERLRKDGNATLIEDLQRLRTLCTFLQLRGRLALFDGDVTGSLHAVQTGLAMARHAAECPCLIADLIGFYLASRMGNLLEELLQHPKTPNLYWALTDLPQPLIDLRLGLQGERVGAYGNFPGLAEAAADPNAGPMTPEQIQKCVERLLDPRFFPQDENLGVINRLVLGTAVSRKHEEAKKALIALGRPKEKVEALPHLEVALLHAMADYDRALDDFIKWQSLPYPVAWPRIQATIKGQRKGPVLLMGYGGEGPAIPLTPLMIPALQKILQARGRIDRRFAALRCVEAIRLFAAAHDGTLPAQLDDIQDVPVPLDPVTGKAFQYQCNGGRAVLFAEPFPGLMTEDRFLPAYELILKR